ncbi:MAG: hypothetical protein V7644_2437 [Actinomycetota bacterium]
MVNAYKFLASGAVGLFSRHKWPTPAGGVPGEWVRVEGELRPCLSGIHACSASRLVDWLDEELWEIELGAPVLEDDGELLAPAGRLLRRIDGWDEGCARAFLSHCLDSTIVLAAESLSRVGRERDAQQLTASRWGPDSERSVLELARSFEDDPASPLLFLADVTRLERGGRPELPDVAPAADAGGPTPFALAANLGYVCAHITAQLAEQESAGSYEERFLGERLSQSRWLAHRLLLHG